MAFVGGKHCLVCNGFKECWIGNREVTNYFMSFIEEEDDIFLNFCYEGGDGTRGVFIDIFGYFQTLLGRYSEERKELNWYCRLPFPVRITMEYRDHYIYLSLVEGRCLETEIDGVYKLEVISNKNALSTLQRIPKSS